MLIKSLMDPVKFVITTNTDHWCHIQLFVDEKSSSMTAPDTAVTVDLTATQYVILSE
jgi:hypothetical protein